MPKKSLVLNGFLGGINNDSDTSDIQSEDRQGRNELASSEQSLLNLPGRVRSKKIGHVGSSSTDNSATVSSAGGTTGGDISDFILVGNKFHRNPGVYKFGEDVEYSGKTILQKPLRISMGSLSNPSNIRANTVAIDAYGGDSSDSNI